MSSYSQIEICHALKPSVLIGEKIPLYNGKVKCKE